MNQNMLKNNKILKAQMGISLPLEEVVRTTGSNISLDNIVKGLRQLTSSGANTMAKVGSKPAITTGSMMNLSSIPLQLTAYAMTQPHAASGAVQLAHQNQVAKKKEDAIKKEQQYWNNRAASLTQALSKGSIRLADGSVLTAFNPDTWTVSGYKIFPNGDRAYVDQNIRTKEYSNPVYLDAKTGAYYKGYFDLTGDKIRVGKTENLMPYSIVPVEKPEWMVSNPSDNLKLESIVLRKKGNKPSAQPSSGTSENGAVNPAPSNPNPENKSKWKQIWEILKGKSNASSNSNYSTWEKITLQDKPWGLQWGVPKLVSAYWRTVVPTEATFKALGWMPINSGLTYQLFPSLRPTMDRIANINSQPENQTQQQENTEKEELPKIPIGYRQNSTRSNLQDSTISQDSTYPW